MGENRVFAPSLEAARCGKDSNLGKGLHYADREVLGWRKDGAGIKAALLHTFRHIIVWEECPL